MDIDTSSTEETTSSTANTFPGEMRSHSETKSNVTTSAEIARDRKTFFYRRRKRELSAITIAVAAYVVYSLLKPDTSPEVHINTGKVVGTVGKSRIGREFYEYVGIPYATPPVGKLRFEPPVPPTKWEGVYSATTHGSQCLQIDIITSFLLGSEDCLYLNVFVPKHAKDSGKLLPVMMWIYGGGFQSGTSDIYRPTYFMDEDVVLVTINYRLGAIGFLNSGDELVRGNQGMKDLVLGLKWIQHNIRNFSGDSKSVTIFGESAGGGAVHYLMLSPMAKGLFHRAISQSGNVLNSWLYSRYPKQQAQSLAEKVNCPTHPSPEMVKCLKNVNAKDIVSTHREMRLPPRPLLGKYAPSVEAVIDDTTFLPSEPLEMLKKGSFADVPWMTGVDSQEGMPFSLEILEQPHLVDWANNDWDDFITQIVFLSIAPNRPKDTSQKLKEFYFNNATRIDSVKSFEGLAEIHAARFFLVSAHHTAKFHSKNAPVYLYYYDYPSEFGFLKLMHSLRGRYFPVVETVYEIVWHWVQKILGMEIHRRGVSHGEEMLLQFSFPFVPGAPVGSSDYEISRDLIRSWVAFAKDPSKLSFQNNPWPSQDKKSLELKYMEIKPNSRGMIDEPFTKQVKLWDSLNIL